MLKELVDIIISESPNSSASPIFFTGSELGGAGYIYCGFFTRCEVDDVSLLSATGEASPASPGVPQTFQSADGPEFDFVGYRIYYPSV